jgi:hypothetical protein
MQPVDADRDEPGALRAMAALLVVCLACLLALLPVAIALRVFAPPPLLMALAGAAISSAALAVKSVAIGWGLAARAWSAHKGSVAVAYVD